MKAIVYDRYGPPDVLRAEDIPRPAPRAGEVLVRVRASSVTTADWRMRAAAYPGILWLPGRMMTGLFRPRHRVLGVDFAGEVDAVGPGAARFSPGDRVFGFCGRGGNAEYVAMPENGPIVATPRGLSDAEAAALPFGALSALVFLRDFGHVAPGQRVAVVGASGGVGAYVVQIARAMGASVTGVASAASHDFLRDLGADAFVDYRETDFTAGSVRHDLVLDTVGATDFAHAQRVLSPDGQFIPLNFGFREMMQALWTRTRPGPRVTIGTSGDKAQDLEALKSLIAEGRLRPVIDSIWPLDRVAEAHAHVETRHRKGAVVVTVG